MRMLPLILVSALGINGCSEPAPDGYRSAAAAITDAEQFRRAADDCLRSTGDRSSPSKACAQAIALFQRIRHTPTHFADKAEWARFSEAYLAGTNLMLMGVLSEACDPKAETAPTKRIKAMCAASTDAKVAAWKELQE